MKFELVIGGWNNTKSALRMSKQGSIISETSTLTLSKDTNTLDITWYNRQFTFTLNNTTWNVKIPPGNNIPPFTKVWFSTGFGSRGKFTFSQGTQEFGTKPAPIVKKKPDEKKVVQEKPPKEEVKVEPKQEPKEELQTKELNTIQEEVQTPKEESKPKKKPTSRSKKKNVV